MVSIKDNNDNFRYERKFFIGGLDTKSLESIVIQNPAFFSEIYHERWVNNIYFDSLNFNNFLDNIIGNMYRSKYRIRWYGEMLSNISKPILEQKIKKGLLGDKKFYNISPFRLERGFNSTSITNLLKKSILNPKVHLDLAEQFPVLLNRYNRKYFESSDHNFRITIDSEQSFYKINKLNNTLSQKITDKKNLILELKYSKEFDQKASKITNNLPFRLTKSSKFSRGIELLYL